MISVHFQGVKRRKEVEICIRKAAEIAFQDQKGESTFILCDDEFIHQYNKEYRDVDRATDVLSFPSDEIDPETSERYFGDVIISLEHAQAQADEAQHPLKEELAMLAIHGVLHLLGYDHSIASEKAVMWQKQKAYLAQLGIVMDQFSGDEVNDANESKSS